MKIGHQLCFIRHTDEKFTCLDKTFYGSRDRQHFIGEGQLITDGNPVFLSILVGQPQAVRVLPVIGRAGGHENAGDSVVFRDAECHHIGIRRAHRLDGEKARHVVDHGNGNPVGVVLNRGVDSEEARSVLYAFHCLHLFQIFGSKTLFGVDPVIGKAGLLKDIFCIFLKAVPFNIEPKEDADAEADHNDHRDELRFVPAKGSQQFAKQHYQSTSAALRGLACSSQDTILPLFTRTTTSAIFAMFWL